ncbi:MAG TPA: hypothetical protein VHQ90_12800 [Thermoanaerobaculia bacterium]|nr:hypothetical protein [Thermoanaerobaculia bacterium]
MTVQSPPPAGPPPAAPPPPPKKGLSPLAWIGIGCGVIIIIGAIAMAAGVGFLANWAHKKADRFEKNPAMAAAETIVQFSPDLEMVSKDEAAQTLTIHNKKTNETVTIAVDDIKNGKLKWKTDQGSASIDMGSKEGFSVKTKDEKGQEATITAGAGAPQNLPSWVPVYPGAKSQGMFSASSNTGSMQSFAVTTPDSIDKVAAFYESRLKQAGFSVQPTLMATGGTTSGGVIAANTPDGKRTMQIVLSTADNQTQAAVSYSEKP